ncbi:MAG: dephospho-CoA kinase [Polyangiaceae bacterium]
MAIRVFGLTGGLASGKSSVGRMIRARGVPVIDADLLAREVVDRGSDGLAEVVKAFGEQVLLPDGTMDRAKVAELVFGDGERRRALNAIVHPRIAALSAQRIGELDAKGEALACYEAALLVENKLVEAFRPLVVVAVPEEVQVARAMARDGATEEQARARIAAQHPLSAKVAAADFVIDNSGELAETERRVTEVLAAIRAKLGLAAG